MHYQQNRKIMKTLSRSFLELKYHKIRLFACQRLEMKLMQNLQNSREPNFLHLAKIMIFTKISQGYWMTRQLSKHTAAWKIVKVRSTLDHTLPLFLCIFSHGRIISLGLSLDLLFLLRFIFGALPFIQLIITLIKYI